jgi:hypothetical protein
MFLLDRVQHGDQVAGLVLLRAALPRLTTLAARSGIDVWAYREGLTEHEAARHYQVSEETARYRCSSGVRQLSHVLRMA